MDVNQELARRGTRNRLLFTLAATIEAQVTPADRDNFIMDLWTTVRPAPEAAAPAVEVQPPPVDQSVARGPAPQHVRRTKAPKTAADAIIAVMQARATPIRFKDILKEVNARDPGKFKAVTSAITQLKKKNQIKNIEKGLYVLRHDLRLNTEVAPS